MEHAMENGTPRRPGGGLKNSSLGQAWLVLLLALVFGAVLAAVQTNLSRIIAANKMNETLDNVPALVWGAGATGRMAEPGRAVAITAGTLDVTVDSKLKVIPVFQVTLDGALAGWVVKAGGQGYADKIELLLGLDPALDTITGLFVLEQKETPGLGNKITEAGWRRQFSGQKTHSPLVVQKGRIAASGGIDAIAGATISSRSVTHIVNQAVSAARANLTTDAFRPLERQ